MRKSNRAAPIPIERITQSILMLRGQRVLIDHELAVLYGVTTKRFNEQVKRNLARFPADFMFQLSPEEASVLRSQIATLEMGRGRHRPEQSSLLSQPPTTHCHNDGFGSCARRANICFIELTRSM